MQLVYHRVLGDSVVQSVSFPALKQNGQCLPMTHKKCAL